MKRRCAGLLMSAAVCLMSSNASAGPVEELIDISIDPANAMNLVVPYRYGGNGMFVSQDGGKTLRWLCSAGLGADLVNKTVVVHSGGDGSLYIGSSEGLLRGDGSGCGFEPVPELAMQYIGDIASDPIDPLRTYVVTTTAMTENGIYLKDGADAQFVAYGSRKQLFVNTLDVAMNGEARRFYETAVITDAATNDISYVVRMSEDEGMTWTEEVYDISQFGPEDNFASFRVVAVDPTNPDHIVAKVHRGNNLDTLVYSPDQGKAGTWQLVAEPKELGGAVFGSNGALYYGDSDNETRGLWVVESMGAAPKLLSDGWRVNCLAFDSANDRLLGCGDNTLFGEVDTDTGEISSTLDLRCAQYFVECPGQEEMSTVCEPQAQADFCHLTHWVIAPVCDIYDRGPLYPMYRDAQTFMCDGGTVVPKAASSGGAAGAAGMGAAAAGAGVGTNAAGASGSRSMNAQPSAAGNGSASAAGEGSVTAPAPSEDSGSSGCGCSTVGRSRHGQAEAGSMYFGLGALGVVLGLWRRRARRSTDA